MDTPPNPADFPSVDLAYQLSVSSYDIAIKRLDSIDARIQTLLAFATSTTAIVVSLSAGRGLRTTYFYFAAASMAFAIILGIWARMIGRIKLVRPNVLFERWLRKDEWTFKKDFIRFAGHDFEKNMGLVTLKWRMSLGVIVLFVLQVAFLVLWAAARPL